MHVAILILIFQVLILADRLIGLRLMSFLLGFTHFGSGSLRPPLEIVPPPCMLHTDNVTTGPESVTRFSNFFWFVNFPYNLLSFVGLYLPVLNNLQSANVPKLKCFFPFLQFYAGKVNARCRC